MEMLFEFELEYDEDSPFGKDPKEDHDYLISEITKYDPEIDIEIVSKAFYYCIDKHKDVYRKSGMPYYTHPLNVTLILLREFSIHDTASIAACLLHDTIEDVEGVNESSIAADFNIEIAELVSAVTKIAHNNMLDGASDDKLKNKALTYRKLFLALVKDIRIILIKLADRLHNMRTLHYLKSQKQKEIALETLNFYIPLAHRLGLNKVKMELENRSFYYTDRSAYEAIRNALNEKRRDFIDYIRVFADTIQNSLNEQKIEHILSIVHKHEYEIYKMIQEGKALSDIDNFYSVVIILNSNNVTECYRAHGVLANAFKTVGFVDYIANPKMDWFKSLFSELFGPDGKRVEIIIRTQEMEKISEEGFASNFSLRSGRIRALEFNDTEIEEWGEWMQDIIESKGERASKVIWESIKVNLFDSELFVYTKSGEEMAMPKGASLIDYAFHISEDTGLHLVAGKVNGVLKDITYKLNSGDQIELISSPNTFPKPEWEDEVVSHRAEVKLHKFFKSLKKSNGEHLTEKAHYDIKLIIKGEDRENMLFDITDVIGRTYIRRINLDTTGALFEGAITVRVTNNAELNKIFTSLLQIAGIRSVVRADEID